MSDSYCAIAFPHLALKDVSTARAIIINHLIDHEIINSELSYCVLSEKEQGYGPGKQFIKATIYEEEQLDCINGSYASFSTGLAVNGLQVLTDHKTVANASGDWLGVNCPSCGKRHSYSGGVSSAIEEWLAKTSAGEWTCEHCQFSAPIVYWDFQNDMVLGNLILKFWNWLEISPDFVEDLSELIGSKAKIIFCRL